MCTFDEVPAATDGSGSVFGELDILWAVAKRVDITIKEVEYERAVEAGPWC